MGRPKLYGVNLVTPVPTLMFTRVKLAAATAGSSRNEWVRTAIAEKLDREDKQRKARKSA